MIGVTEPNTAWHGIAVAPFFFWELAVGLWMTFKGFDRTAPIVVAAMAESSRVPLATSAATTAATIATEAGAA